MCREEYKHVAHSCDADFTDEVKKLLLYRKIVSVEQIDCYTARLVLDNGVVLETCGNEGCVCGNGEFYLDQLNKCDNLITNVETDIEGDDPEEDTFVFKLFVYSEDKKINVVTYSGYDNGYYGIGYDLYVKMMEK